MHDLAVHIGQPIIASAEAVSQARVVQPHEVQDGCVQVVNVDLVLDRVPAEFIRGTEDQSAPDAAESMIRR